MLRSETYHDFNVRSLTRIQRLLLQIQKRRVAQKSEFMFGGKGCGFYHAHYPQPQVDADQKLALTQACSVWGKRRGFRLNISHAHHPHHKQSSFL